MDRSLTLPTFPFDQRVRPCARSQVSITFVFNPTSTLRDLGAHRLQRTDRVSSLSSSFSYASWPFSTCNSFAMWGTSRVWDPEGNEYIDMLSAYS